MKNGMLSRLYRKALSNQIAIAVGSSLSDDKVSIPSLAKEIITTYKLDFYVKHSVEYFKRWNELIELAEKVVQISELTKFVRNKIGEVKPTHIHQRLAILPISNFIDTTFDRSLYKAVVAAGRTPILHDWQNQRMGSWKQSNPENPNIFFMLPNAETASPWYGVYEPTGKNTQNKIQLENLMEMLTEKDLVMLEYSSYEAEFILHLYALVSSCDKVVSDNSSKLDPEYVSTRGVYIGNFASNELLDKISPSEGEKYGIWDVLFPSRKLIDISRTKSHDCFISYFSGDKEFVGWVDQQLQLRGIKTWRDEREIEIGDSMTDKIQEGLVDSHTFTIVLTPDALQRPWVKEELKAAYARKLAGDLKILPILHKECDIPPFLADYKYADFRDERRYYEQLSLLERSIKNAVKQARGKK